VCLSVPCRILTLLHGLGCNLGNGRRYPVVVYCWADLQSVHGFHCYDNLHVCKLIALYTAKAYSAEREMSASACTRSMAGCHCYWCNWSSLLCSIFLFFWCTLWVKKSACLLLLITIALTSVYDSFVGTLINKFVRTVDKNITSQMHCSITFLNSNVR